MVWNIGPERTYYHPIRLAAFLGGMGLIHVGVQLQHFETMQEARA
jgi:hypothetical protein